MKIKAKKQNGSVLIAVVIMVSLISMIGITSARMSIFSELASRHDRDRQIALQSAESALSDAEQDILGLKNNKINRACMMDSNHLKDFIHSSDIKNPCQTGLYAGLCYLQNKSGQAWKSVIDHYKNEVGSSSNHQTVEYGQFTGAQFPHAKNGGLTSKLPRYTIEAVPFSGVTEDIGSIQYAFLITAMGFGSNEKTQVILQSLFYKPVQHSEVLCSNSTNN